MRLVFPQVNNDWRSKAQWDEAFYLNAIFITPEYLARKYITIELRTTGFQVDEELLGTGVLPLDRTFSAQPEEFRVALTNDDQPAGWIIGMAHTRAIPQQQQRYS